MFKSKNKYSMDINAAGSTLKNVFSACDTAPNAIPLEKIAERSRLSFFTDNLYIIIASVLLTVTLVAPLFFPHNSAFVSVDFSAGRPLTVTGSEMTQDTFSISVEGGVLSMEDSYMEGADDSYVAPSSFDSTGNTLVFPYSPQEYNIYLYDENGRCLHLLLSPHK